MSATEPLADLTSRLCQLVIEIAGQDHGSDCREGTLTFTEVLAAHGEHALLQFERLLAIPDRHEVGAGIVHPNPCGSGSLPLPHSAAVGDLLVDPPDESLSPLDRQAGWAGLCVGHELEFHHCTSLSGALTVPPDIRLVHRKAITLSL